MSSPLQQTRVVQAFCCVGDACADTCCKGWGMQLTRETVALYEAQAPELLEAVTSGEAEYIMKRDEVTDYCVKLEGGWCGIHAGYGEAMLGDACHFFPRITRSFSGALVMSASLSCPEIARLSLSTEAPADMQVASIDRLPFSLKEYAGQGEGEAMLRIQRMIIEHARAHAPERALMHLVSVAQSLMAQPADQWEAAAGFYLRMADARLPTAEPAAADPFMLINALMGLVANAPASPRPRLLRSIDRTAEALALTLDWTDLRVQMRAESAANYLRMQAQWRERWQAMYQPQLSRWLEAQLSAASFPFAGLGDTIIERIHIIAVRFATLKLMLQAELMLQQAPLDEAEWIRIVQSLARFMDHLASAELSLRMYEELGWRREARLRALLGDVAA